MNTVEVSFTETAEEALKYKVVEFTLKVLESLSIENWEVSIVFSNDEYIRNLNNIYRGKDEPTDVLSFTQDLDEIGDVVYAGDIVLSRESIGRNAIQFNVTEEEEIKRVIVHGLLHLSGLDHETNSRNEKMLLKQETLLELLKGEKLF